jgi:adenylate kinase family enzyme
MIYYSRDSEQNFTIDWEENIMAKKKLDDVLLEKFENSLTFNPLMNALRQNDKKNQFTSNIITYFHKTGFPLFDYYFGSVINVYDKLGAIERQDPMVGQAAGVFNTFIGATGSGKTTLAIQIAANIIRQYESGSVIHYDCENRLLVTRVQVLTGLPIDYFSNGKYIIRGGSTSLEEMQEMIVKLYVAKMQNKSQLETDTGRVDELGRPIIILQPTVIIIDSIANIIPDSFSFNNASEVTKAIELRGNTEGARDAKTFRGFFKDVLPLCKEANIIIYGINHLTSNMSMNAFAGPQRQQNYLDSSEAIPGGKAPMFNAFNALKMVAKPNVNDTFTEDRDGFAGHPVICEPIKSSSNQSGNTRAGKSFEMIFAHKSGFDNLRSLIWYGKQREIIVGNMPSMKFAEDPSYSFSWKNIHKDKDENPIWDGIKKFIIPDLEKQLSFVEPADQKFDERSLDY